MAGSTETVGLRQYLEVLWRRKWIVLLFVVVVPAGVVAFSLSQPTEYAATARIIAVSQSATLSVATGADVNVQAPDERGLQTLASFVATPTVAERAAEALGDGTTPGELRAAVEAEVEPEANVITVTARGPTPAVAKDRADAVATTFVAWRQETQRAALEEALRLVEAQLKAEPAGSPERPGLLERRNQLEVLRTLVSGGVEVGEEATLPTEPASPRPLRDGVLAAGAALLLGVGVAFVREALDVKVHSVDEIAGLTDLPVIGAIPDFRRQERGDALALLDDPGSPAAEAFRFLRTNLEFVDFNHDVTTILVSSPLPSQGKSTTIVNLSVALLRSGKRVAVAEGDLRRPALHRFFKVGNAQGVTTVVSGATTLDDALQVLTFRGATPKVRTRPGDGGPGQGSDDAGELKLTLLTSGPLPPNPGEIVTSSQLGEIIDTLKRDHDYVLVDAPPMFAVGDAAALAAKVDGMIVILRFDQTTQDTLHGVHDFVQRIPTRVMGIVVTGVPRGAKSRYYRYEGYDA